ncbi:MAG TPA: DUF5610 domain-containing protein [Methylophilaceae bacterium]
MSIPNTINPITINPASIVPGVANQNADSTQPASTTTTSVPDGSRAQLNTSIVQAALSVSISSQNEPLALLYKSAIDSLNEALKPTLGDNAIQNAASQDNTPEGTSGRIVSISTGFFTAYKAQNPNLSDSDALTQFMATIRGGFEKGFKEATDILDGLKVLGGSIADNIDKTYQLVIKGYADFEASFAKPATGADAGTTGGSTQTTSAQPSVPKPGSADASVPLSSTTTTNS